MSIKVSDTFHRSLVECNDNCEIIENGWVIATFTNKYKAKAAAHAINNHDRLTEQLKKLQLQCKDLTTENMALSGVAELYILEQEENEALTEENEALKQAVIHLCDELSRWHGIDLVHCMIREPTKRALERVQTLCNKGNEDG